MGDWGALREEGPGAEGLDVCLTRPDALEITKRSVLSDTGESLFELGGVKT